MKKIFVYTDGSCRPNPGYSGYGIHIVIGDTDIKSTTIRNKFKLTDKGYVNKKSLKALGVKEEYGIDKVIEVYGFKKDSITNNQAELDAVIEAYKILPKLKLTYEDIDNVVLLTDSTYILGYVNRIINNKLDINDETPNKDKIEELAGLMKICLFDTEFVKVEGHSNDLGNDRADLLALMGHNLNLRLQDKKELQKQHHEDKDFWKDKDPDKDIFFGKKLFYFFNDVNKTYYMFNYKENADIGKKLPEVQYAIIKTSEPDEIVNKLLETFTKHMELDNKPFVVSLDKIKDKKLYSDLVRYKDDFIMVDLEKNYREPFLSLKTIDNTEIIRELYPQVLSRKVNDNFELLEDVFAGYVKERSDIKVLDLTDMIYTTNDKGKTVIRPEFTNDKFKLKVMLEDKYKMFVYPKYDLPPRNTLKRFESLNPRVYLLYKDLGNFFEYYTLLDLGDTKILTTNFYANKTVKEV